MDKQRHPTRNGTNQGRMWAGIIILSIGAILLAGRLGIDWIVPHELFSWRYMWPTMFIVIGLIIGANSNYRNPVAVFFLIFGGFFLLKNVFHFDIGAFLWPGIIIGIGLWLLLGKDRGGNSPRGPNRQRRYRPGDRQHYEWDKRVDYGAEGNQQSDSSASSGATAFEEPEEPQASNTFSSDDYLKSTAVFSEVRKILISKNFQGGEVVNIFGGTDINLMQADIHEPIIINVFQLFAGTKIIVPSHWKIQSEVVSVFGEVDDRRFIQGIPHDDQKVVYIKGTSIFGGITIKNI